MTFPDRPVPNPDSVLESFPGGWAVLVNLDTAAAVALNPTALLVWRHVDGRRTVAEIASAVAGHFRDAPPTVMDDVAAVIAGLSEEGLVGRLWNGGSDELQALPG